MKKRILSLLLAVLLLSGAFPATARAAAGASAPSAAFAGDGTAASPYLISTAEDMQTLDALVEGGETFSGAYVKLGGDVVLPADFNGVGAQGKPFSGDFDGGAHQLTVPEGGKAVFTFVRGAVIHDLDVYGPRIADYGLVSLYTVDNGVSSVAVIDNVTLKAGTQTLYSGFIGGYAGGSNLVTIRNSTIEAGVVIGYDHAQDHIGSFAGEFNGTITNCISDADVYGGSFVGGIAANKGQSMGDFAVDGCSFGGSVTAAGDFVGGVVGAGYAGTGQGMHTAWATRGVVVKNCVCTGTVSGGQGVGGILGGEGAQAQAWENGPTCIQNNTFTGAVSGTRFVGDVIGYILSLNKYSYISGNTAAGSLYGGVGAVDTDAHATGMFDGVYYFNTSTADGRTAAQIRAEVEGHALENTIVVTTLGAAGLGQLKVDHHRMDDPLTPGGEITVSELKIGGQYKKVYEVGESFSTAGMTVTATYSNGSSVQVPVDEVVFTGFDSSAPGRKPVTAAYGGRTTVFYITVSGSGGNTIAVTLTILGDTHHGLSAEENHGLWLGGLSDWLEETEYYLDEGAVVYDLLLQAVAADDSIVMYASWNSLYDSYYVYAMEKDGLVLTQKDDGRVNSGWMVALNGRHTKVGVSLAELSNGDKVVLHWSDDYISDEAEGNRQAFLAAKPEVKAENVKSGKIQLTWEEIPGAVSYKVFVADEKGEEYTLAAEVEDEAYTFDGKVGQMYCFKVTAIHSTGMESQTSDPVRKYRVPAQVTSLKVSSKSKQVTLTWKKITGAKKYFVYMSKNGKTGWKKIGTAKTNKFVYKKGKVGAKLYFKVQAVTANGKKGEFSKVVSVKVKK